MRLSSSVHSLFMVTTALEIFLFRLDSLRGCPYVGCACFRTWAVLGREVLNSATQLRDELLKIQTLSFRRSVLCTCEIYSTKLC